MAGFRSRDQQKTRETSTLYGDFPFGRMAHSVSRRELHPLLVQWLKDSRASGRMLEVGCGGGDWLRTTTDLGMPRDSIIGVDIAPRALRLLHDEGFHLCEADAARLPFPDDAFPSVLCYGVLHHTACPMDTLRELVRVTAPGGSLCLAVYYWGSPLPWLVHRLARPVRWLYWRGHRWAAVPFYAVFRALMRVAGPRLLGREPDEQTMRTLFMDQCITPYVHSLSRRRMQEMVRALGCAIEKEDYAGRRSLLAVVVRVPKRSRDSIA